MAYTQVNLAELPAPKLVRELSYEDILAEMKSACSILLPEMAPVLQLESEPAVKVLQVAAAYVLMVRAEINDAARGVLLAYATGSDLDHLGALFGVERSIVQDATDLAPAILEDDGSLRQRIQLSLEGFSVAGPRGAYEFHALSAHPKIKDVSVLSPGNAELPGEPGTVRVFVLTSDGDGTASPEVVTAVSMALNAENIRPLTDSVTVATAIIAPFSVEAEIEIFDGPDSAVVIAEAEARLAEYLASTHSIGATVAISGIHGALHRPGVRLVTVSSPAEDIHSAPNVAPFCTGVTITTGGADD